MAVLGNVDDDISQAPQIIQSGTEAVTKEKSYEVNLSDPLGSKRSKNQQEITACRERNVYCFRKYHVEQEPYSFRN